ncbi:DUF19 domain-containing protein [Caenorhabditis elegans]|uniref:DUF19 domain-containing protein n=1 Tax=Caenorhabditis elegans TaxID=6239 RepID=O45889_CAEEL|nr:DUF19 domain-containing protein [Caenorhabditis elegans]CAB04897.1 DUF19 domain-containing protein [Caenorhabditis elegans]|eukprot:NP_493398.1 Uncharacterized protein CELE_W04A4.3 [Caenorhabditis elegans]
MKPAKQSIFVTMVMIYSVILIITIFTPVQQIHVDIIDITGFAKCALTTKWFRTQLAPFLGNLTAKKGPKNLKMVYHPLSIGQKKGNGTAVATCENGWLECQLNKLQCCTKKYSRNVTDFEILAVLECIQGKQWFGKALDCLQPRNLQTL